MSEVTPKTRSAADMSSAGLPTWSGVTIVLAALLTGLGISLVTGSIGTPYLMCFVVSALIVALFTEARGLFLTVAAIPLSFGLLTVLTSWLLGRSLSPHLAPFSVTSLVTAVYPALQFFPVLAVVTIVAGLLGWVRVRLLNRQITQREERLIIARRRTSESNRTNLLTANRARRSTEATAIPHSVRPPRTAPNKTAEPAAAIARESRNREAARPQNTAAKKSRWHSAKAATPAMDAPKITVEELRRRNQQEREVEKRRRREVLNRDLYGD